MGTKAYIIVKIDDADINRKCRFDATKVAHPVQIHPNQKDGLPEITISGKYLACHHLIDSFPHYLGKELKEHYDTYDKVLNLCAGGVYDTILGQFTFDAKPLPEGEYCVRNSLSCSSYCWGLNKPEVFANFADLEEEMAHSVMSYAYLFENGRWSYKLIYRSKWKPL